MKSRVKTILIPNATGPSNIGDQAMLEPLINLIRHDYPEAKLIIHTSNLEEYADRSGIQIKETIHHLVGFSDPTFLGRSFRLANLLRLLIKVNFFPPSKNYDDSDLSLSGLIHDYFNADLIIFAGGGYFRSQSGFTQIINNVLLLVHVYLAQLSKATTVVAPISFGPFAQQWLEKLNASLLKKLDLVCLREKFSYQRLQDYGNTNNLLSSDLALLLPQYKAHSTKDSSIKLGVTLRKWLPKSQQQIFEAEVTRALIDFSNNHDIEVVPLVQVFGKKYGTYDNEIVSHLKKELEKADVKVTDVVQIKTLYQAIKTYAQLDMLLGMRMHSNIIAATQGTPFVAISYEYKTEGIAQQLGMTDYVIESEKVTQKNLTNNLEEVYRNRKHLTKIISRNIADIQQRQFSWWNTLAEQLHK